MTYSKIIALLILGLLSFITFTWAGGPLYIAGSDGQTPITYPAGGANITINYDLGNLGARYTNAQADAIVDNAIALWNNVSTSTVNLSKGSDMPVDVTAANIDTYYNAFSDGLNPIVYDTDGSIIDLKLGSGAKNSVLGFAGSAYYTSTAQFIEGRAVINGYYPDANPGFPDSKETIVLAHELGHFIGLDHSQLDSDQGLTTSNYALMYPQAYRTEQSLHEDDIAAVSRLYPATNINSSYGMLTGVFLDTNNNPILGANIWAKETTTGKVYSIVSDYKKQSTGYFSIYLPPGTYHLSAESISNSFIGGSSVGPYSETSGGISFQAPHPITPITFGAPENLNMDTNCTIDVTFKLDGSGTVNSDSCIPTAEGTVYFLENSYTALESDGSVSVTVRRGSSDVGAVNVDYLTITGGTASAGNDYTAASGTLSWADGEIGTKSFTVSLINDSTYEQTETIQVKIQNVTNGANLGMSTSLIYINDDEP
ncbi:MAG: matrixin family metalloprotease, partial [Gammaproteobacteria bacterium]|nr:matrixin family metalloprotease [Gammaproteobacteria bacterium]